MHKMDEENQINDKLKIKSFHFCRAVLSTHRFFPYCCVIHTSVLSLLHVLLLLIIIIINVMQCLLHWALLSRDCNIATFLWSYSFYDSLLINCLGWSQDSDSLIWIKRNHHEINPAENWIQFTALTAAMLSWQ